MATLTPMKRNPDQTLAAFVFFLPLKIFTKAED